METRDQVKDRRGFHIEELVSCDRGREIWILQLFKILIQAFMVL